MMQQAQPLQANAVNKLKADEEEVDISDVSADNKTDSTQ